MTELSQQQQRLWNELVLLRAHIEYLSLYELGAERIDRGLKIFLAIAASGSIAAWAVWHEFAMLWGAIIAVSQFIGAAKDHLPFEKRAKATRELGAKLEGLFVRWETSWNEAASGELSEADINSRLSELKKAKAEFVGACLTESTLPDKPDLHGLAASAAARYFDVVYGGGNQYVEEHQG